VADEIVAVGADMTKFKVYGLPMLVAMHRIYVVPESQTLNIS